MMRRYHMITCRRPGWPTWRESGWCTLRSGRTCGRACGHAPSHWFVSRRRHRPFSSIICRTSLNLPLGRLALVGRGRGRHFGGWITLIFGFIHSRVERFSHDIGRGELWSADIGATLACHRFFVLRAHGIPTLGWHGVWEVVHVLIFGTIIVIIELKTDPGLLFIRGRRSLARKYTIIYLPGPGLKGQVPQNAGFMQLYGTSS